MDQLYEDLLHDNRKVHAAVLFSVPPGKGDAFVDAWLDEAEDTIKEEGNRVYSLRKVASDNTRYVAYGIWDTEEDLEDHFDSEHAEDLRKFVDDKDIQFVLERVDIVEDRD